MNHAMIERNCETSLTFGQKLRGILGLTILSWIVCGAVCSALWWGIVLVSSLFH